MADVKALDTKYEAYPNDPSLLEDSQDKECDKKEDLEWMDYNQNCVEFFSQHFGPGYLKLLFGYLKPKENSGDVFKVDDGRAN